MFRKIIKLSNWDNISYLHKYVSTRAKMPTNRKTMKTKSVPYRFNHYYDLFSGLSANTRKYYDNNIHLG